MILVTAQKLSTRMAMDTRSAVPPLMVVATTWKPPATLFLQFDSEMKPSKNRSEVGVLRSPASDANVDLSTLRRRRVPAPLRGAQVDFVRARSVRCRRQLPNARVDRRRAATNE